jgi:hypothetical protein
VFPYTQKGTDVVGSPKKQRGWTRSPTPVPAHLLCQEAGAVALEPVPELHETTLGEAIRRSQESPAGILAFSSQEWKEEKGEKPKGWSRVSGHDESQGIWITPVILAMWETEVRGQPGQIVPKT